MSQLPSASLLFVVTMSSRVERILGQLPNEIGYGGQKERRVTEGERGVDGGGVQINVHHCRHDQHDLVNIPPRNDRLRNVITRRSNRGTYEATLI